MRERTTYLLSSRKEKERTVNIRLMEEEGTIDGGLRVSSLYLDNGERTTVDSWIHCSTFLPAMTKWDGIGEASVGIQVRRARCALRMSSWV